MRNFLVSRPSGRVVAAVAVCMVLAVASLVYSRRAMPERPGASANPVASAPVTRGGSERPAPEPEAVVEAGRRRPEPPRTQPVRPRPAAEAITRVFPEITEAIADWQAFRPEMLTVAVHPDLPVQFTLSALRDEGRYVTWVGRNADLPGASFVGVATANGYDAILVLPGASQFSFHIRGDELVVAEADPAQELCGLSPRSVSEPASPPTAGDVVKVVYAPGFVPGSDTHAAVADRSVDVLFGYDATALAEAGQKSSDPVGYLDGQTKAKVETSNLALAQSGVTAFAWRYQGLLPVPAYTRTGKLSDDLAALIPPGAANSWVAGKRYDYGADQFMLLVGRGDSDFAGRAYSAPQRALRPEHAVAVMIWDASFFTLAHELAHNFGCQHDRENGGDDNAPVPDNDGRWCYGHLWPIPAPNDFGTAGTIMSYADWRIPYFSNPAISVQVTGSMVGWSWNPALGTHQIGRAETDPKAANNTRVLVDQALTLSQNSAEIELPQIVQQPASITVNEGNWLQLGVSATGGGLVYQWLKESAPIDGATSSIFGKSAAPADAGNYQVVVKNRLGSVTSATVSITVNRITTSNPSPPSGVGGGGGGGGGGAVSLWFLGLLALLVAGRGSRPGHR